MFFPGEISRDLERFSRKEFISREVGAKDNTPS
jgi:hypothetical protein